jgi:hypothetical protein
MKRRMQIALERAQECERAAANITDRFAINGWIWLGNGESWRSPCVGRITTVSDQETLQLG